MPENDHMAIFRFRTMNDLFRWMTHCDLGRTLNFRFQSAAPGSV